MFIYFLGKIKNLHLKAEWQRTTSGRNFTNLWSFLRWYVPYQIFDYSMSQLSAVQLFKVPFFQRKASILDLLSALFKIHEATEVLKSLSSWKNPLVCHAMQQVRSIKLKRKKCLRTSRQKENNYFSFSTRICHFNIHAWLSLSLGNNPFYSCVVSCQAFQQRWGEGGPSYDTNLAAFQMQITLLSC